jgi:hypothetical protein
MSLIIFAAAAVVVATAAIFVDRKLQENRQKKPNRTRAGITRRTNGTNGTGRNPQREERVFAWLDKTTDGQQTSPGGTFSAVG